MKMHNKQVFLKSGFRLFAFKAPTCARVRTWRVSEANNLIYIWHHSERQEPTWFPEIVEQLTTGPEMWSYRGRSEYQVRYSCNN